MERIVAVDEYNIEAAGAVHSAAWQESHRSFCAAEFVEKHTPAAQTAYLRREMDAGKRVYLLVEKEPVGIVSVQGSLIENLYVLPRMQNRGYGTRLLRYAIDRCVGTPTLWILDNNRGARRLYERNGFRETGKRKQLTETLSEIEMAWDRLGRIRQAERQSHEEVYTAAPLFAPGSWLEKPVKTVMELLPLFEGYDEFRALDLGCGVGRNSIPVARYFEGIPCRVDCVDILDLAIEKLRENAAVHGVAASVWGMVSAIDDYPIQPGYYDLILAVSALEHVDSKATFLEKLRQIRDGLRPGGVACLIVNTSVRERDRATGEAMDAQFEVNLPAEEFCTLASEVFCGWEVLRQKTVHQQYDIPRGSRTARLDTDAVTLVLRRNRG